MNNLSELNHFVTQSGTNGASPNSYKLTLISGIILWIASAAALQVSYDSTLLILAGSFISSAAKAEGWSTTASANKVQNRTNSDRPYFSVKM